MYLFFSIFFFSAKILLFYLIFYVVLSAFFTGYFAIFYQTLELNAPKYKLDSSLIGTNPGLGFRPMPPESNVESTLIWYKASDEGNFRIWAEQLDSFLQAYNKSGRGAIHNENRMLCDYGRPAEKGKVCDVDIKNWHPCTAANFYNYQKSAPCIFLKLNKVRFLLVFNIINRRPKKWTTNFVFFSFKEFIVLNCIFLTLCQLISDLQLVTGILQRYRKFAQKWNIPSGSEKPHKERKSEKPPGSEYRLGIVRRRKSKRRRKHGPYSIHPTSWFPRLLFSVR